MCPALLGPENMVENKTDRVCPLKAYIQIEDRFYIPKYI
jgi:hypothetical protein